ncbi:uncharacterized protein LOC112637232 [Camponotus floridanus]|uniref:uncharacterized protein LOC112637232 n=1 Tax=Camponotus floridanus TaxID=104421 RepID=UPI00059D3FB9|nr:uncharacterized protein LOC112637232 [Camponotus floridanus]
MPATMNILKLDLERKKKSEGRSFLDSSSSSDEELASDEENECTRQKGGEESDGRRPMAEEERKVSDETNAELLLPWKTEVAPEKIQPQKLIEEVSESKQYIADDAEENLHGKQILDDRKSIHDPLDDYIVGREVTNCKKILLESATEKEEISNSQKSTDNDNNKTNDRKNEKTSTCSVSSDTADLKQTLEENEKLTSAITDMTDDASSKNIKSYQRKSKEHPFGSKLSSIREEMREFCDRMDKFVDENKIVFKNGEVEGFWGKEKMDENLQTDPIDDSEIQETETEVPTSKEDKLQWWNTKERNLKVREIIRQREDEARKHKVEIKDAATSNNSNCSSLEDRMQVMDTADNFQDVYDLMTMKTCPSYFPDSTETYSVKDEENYTCEQSEKESQEKSCGVFSSIFAELRNRDIQETNKSKVSSELMILEEKLDSEKSTIDTKQKNIPQIINMTDLIDSAEESSKCKKLETNENYSKIEDLEDKFNHLLLTPSEMKKNIDESDDDSFKTATSLVEEILETDQESPEVLRLFNTEDKIVDSNKNENVDLDECEIISNKERNNLICENKKVIKIEESSVKMEMSNSEQKLSSDTEESNSQMESLIRAIDRLTLGKNANQRPSRLTGKRTLEIKDVEINNKKSFLIEEVKSERKSKERKSRSQISEKCRQHMIQETKKFAKKVSPLIDKCITNLIKDSENVDRRSQYHKYKRRSLGEYLPSDFVSKMDLNKPAGDSGNNWSDKYDNKSDNVINVQFGKQELKQTINSESDSLSANDSDIQSLGNILRQSESICESESSSINADASLYKEFCDHLQKLKSEKKLLVKSNFIIEREEGSKEKLPDDKSVQKSNPTKKSVKPLIEVISENPAISNDSKSILKQEEKSHTSQNVSDCYKKDAVFRLVEETPTMSEDSENHVNKNAINLTEGEKTEMFSMSCTLDNAKCKEECVLLKEKRECAAIKKSIEMQVAQEN